MCVNAKDVIMIKEQIDSLFREYKDDIINKKQYQYAIFSYICEIVLVKSCLENELIDIELIDMQDINTTKDKIKKINPIFNEIFELGNKYKCLVNKDIYVKLKNILQNYEYKNLDFDFLGKLYENYINKQERKDLGQFYTPESIIDEILDDIGIEQSNQNLFNSRILDPACGSGSFIVRIVNRIVKIGLDKKIQTKTIIKFICNNIYGFDIKEFSIYMSKVNVLIQILPLLKWNLEDNIDFNLYVTDSLTNLTDDLDNEECNKIIDIKHKRGIFEDGFDYIIGNPPYFKARNLSNAQKKYFHEICSGQLNIYSMFLYLGVKLLKPLVGKLGYIIPESIRAGKYFGGIRNYIFSNCTITHLVTFNCRKTNFNKALQGVMIICLCNGVKNVNEKKVIIKNVNNESYLLKKKFNNKIEAKYEDVVRNINGYNLLIICNKLEHYNIINKVYSECVFLNDNNYGYKVSTGKLVWNQKKEFLTDEENNECRHLIWAKQIETYKVNNFKKDDGKNKYVRLDDSLKKLETNGQVILIRRTSTKEQKYRIIASLYSNPNDYFIENHINYIHRIGRPRASLQYLVAVLNSELLNFIAKQIMGNTQLSVSELNILPIKYNKSKIIDKLVNLIYETNDKELINKLIKKINEKVNKIYGISNDIKY